MSSPTLQPHRKTVLPVARPAPAAPATPREAVLELVDVGVAYGGTPAVSGVTLSICGGEVTAIIGPSGCGKSSLLRSLNRMNDLVPHATVSGRVTYRGEDLYGPRVDPVEVRRRIGMVFQKPNPFPKSIYDNVAFGPRAHGVKRGLDEVVERSLHRAALWDEVSGRLDQPAAALSGGQQQRLCIARALAVDPDVLLMDEPCSALDPIATSRIEDLVRELRDDVAIVIVTHNLQQAARVSDHTVFITAEVAGDDDVACGLLVEAGPTHVIFSGAEDERTRAYVSGQFG